MVREVFAIKTILDFELISSPVLANAFVSLLVVLLLLLFTSYSQLILLLGCRYFLLVTGKKSIQGSWIGASDSFEIILFLVL
jgi:hypothetical protein